MHVFEAILSFNRVKFFWCEMKHCYVGTPSCASNIRGVTGVVYVVKSILYIIIIFMIEI